MLLRPSLSSLLALLLLVPAATPPVRGERGDPFQMHVRPTPHLSPEEERAALELPPGFEIRLVAAEPEIRKPLNLAFDEEGRLWITETQEYPYPVPPGREGRDSIKILEDTDGDGRAEKITTFATGLNIPIGIYPWRGGAIAFSIPYLWHLQDTDGDGRCDHREPLYGPFGWERDTHGLNNGFRRSFDGWVYACHGFSNETTVQGRDGQAIRMVSGNTYRFRLDGSRIEHFTHGQVNPFGMAIDGLGNLFTADCHSKPAYRLLRGGYYPSFGRPHDGLGFVPPLMEHDHGSTAICGIVRYQGRNFPPSFRGDLFIGNVVTCRINRDRLVSLGATLRAEARPDFLISRDPWFRPVDLREAPDGTVYVADFYNRIIGHYEVPLDHPGRDRTSGRIWRIVYRGEEESLTPEEARPEPIARARPEGLIAALEHPSLAWRLLATHRLADGAGRDAVPLLKRALGESPHALARSHLLWVLARLGAAGEEILAAAAADPAEEVRVHAMKVLAETGEWPPLHRRLAREGLGDRSAPVQLAAVEALGRRGGAGDARALLALLERVPPQDIFLRHAVRIALRDLLGRGDHLEELAAGAVAPEEEHQVAAVLVSVPTARAAEFLIEHAGRHSEPPEVLRSFLRHAAAHLPGGGAARLARLARERFGADPDLQLELLESIRQGLAEAGAPAGPALEDWAARLARELLDSLDEGSLAWRNAPLEGKARREDPWEVVPWRSGDGREGALFLSSLPAGEELTGRLRSPPFPIPRRLRLWIAGHAGPPGAGGPPRSFVRIRDAATGEVLAEAAPPGDDRARPVDWDLERGAGGAGFLEIEDGHEEPGFAWIAAGCLEPPVAALPALSPRRVASRLAAVAGLAGRFGLEELRSRLVELVRSDLEITAREALAGALVALRPDGRLAALVRLAGDPAAGPALREKVLRAVVERSGPHPAGISGSGAAGSENAAGEPRSGSGPDAGAGSSSGRSHGSSGAGPSEADRKHRDLRELLAEALRAVPARLQASLALDLAGDREGAGLLLELARKGLASPRLLQRDAVREKLLAAGLEGTAALLEELTRDLPAPAEELLETMRLRVEAFRRSRPSIAAGAAVFEKHCSPCHQVAGKGSIVGPQLDGIGGRGLERLVEDILDPNRNVDVAFRSTTIVLAGGKVLSGLFRREEGKILVFADSQGQEFAVRADEVVARELSGLSLMPENFAEVLGERDFLDLLGFLLEK